MLKPLQPGMQPLGQFDLEDDNAAYVKGGEVAAFQSITFTTDGYAADVYSPGLQIHLKLDKATAGQLHGLVDEGDTGYGTLFGNMIGAVAGQGTGLGTMSTTGVVVIGPKTTNGSGKAALWTQPGLYGVTSDAWTSSSEFNAASLHDGLYGDAFSSSVASTDGKLTTTSSSNGAKVAIFLGHMKDSSLVSTTNRSAGIASATEYAVVYLTGVQV
jgi:hypothetical protein